MGLTHSKSVSLFRIIYSPRASAAVIRFLGSIINILLMRSFAPVDIDGHGELFKSSLPAKIASNMPFSVSKKQKTYWFHHQLSKENSNKICSDSKILVSGLVKMHLFVEFPPQISLVANGQRQLNCNYFTYQPKKEGPHLEGCTKWLQHSRHPSPSHSSDATPLVPHSMHFLQYPCTLSLENVIQVHFFGISDWRTL